MKPNAWIGFFILAIVFWGLLIGFVGSMQKDIAALQKENAILQDDLNTYKESSVYWKEKCEHYQSANEALIKYSEPEAINRATKDTPLPKLVMKG